MTLKNLTTIDPALGLMAEFSKVSQGTSSHVQRMRQEAIFTDGIMPAKIKALVAALW